MGSWTSQQPSQPGCCPRSPLSPWAIGELWHLACMHWTTSGCCADEESDGELDKPAAKPARVLPTEPFISLGLLASGQLPACNPLQDCYMPGGGRCEITWEPMRTVSLSQDQLQVRVLSLPGTQGACSAGQRSRIAGEPMRTVSLSQDQLQVCFFHLASCSHLK